MLRARKAPFIALALLVFALITTPAHADTVVIGSPFGGIGPPFGVDADGNQGYAAGGRYQQIYSAARFTGPVTITQIAFSTINAADSSPGIANYDFRLGLGTTSSTTLAPIADFDANGSTTTVFSGPLTVPLSLSQVFDLVIPITAFTYDPNDGNLLLDVLLNTATEYSGGDLFFQANNSIDVGRVYQPGGVGPAAVNGYFGLYTQITFTPATPAPVPEPATMILLGTGLAGIGIKIRRRRQAKT